MFFWVIIFFVLLVIFMKNLKYCLLLNVYNNDLCFKKDYMVYCMILERVEFGLIK